jgi:hypothetical protein
MNVDILRRALALESRSFIEYMAHSSPPVDLERYPDVLRGLEEIHAEEEAMVGELVAAIVAEDGDPDVTATYDLRYSYYNYLSTTYALKVIAEQLERSLARFDTLVAEAAADPETHDFLRRLRDRKRAVLARVEDMRRAAAEAGGKKAAALAAPAKAAGH